jgi:predicted ester cyclase
VADPDTLRRNVEAMHTRLIAGGETDLAAELVHPEFVNHEADPERSRGPEGAAATSAWLRRCFGELSFEVHHVIVQGDLVAAHMTMHGTHEGGLPPGLPGTHKPFSARHVHIYRFADDGRATEHWAVRDDLGAMMQIGAIPGAPA